MKACEEYNKRLWETFRNQHQLMRGASQAIQRAMHAVESHGHSVQVVWEAFKLRRLFGHLPCKNLGYRVHFAVSTVEGLVGIPGPAYSLVSTKIFYAHEKVANHTSSFLTFMCDKCRAFNSVMPLCKRPYAIR